MKKAGVKAGDKVAIAGFGGLGHMALQYAVSFGAEVTVFDITEEKREFAKELGAVKYVNINNPKEMKGMENYFDFIISTIPTTYDPLMYLNMVKVGGDLAIVGIPGNEEAPSININKIPYNKRIWRSLIGGITQTQEVINYSIAHDIYPMVEVIPVQKVNEAIKNVVDGEVHFRYVMDMKTL